MRTITYVFIVSSLLLFACSDTSQPNPTPYPERVDWPTAVEILHSGDVVEVVQLHNLSVTLRMDDGSLINTVEPLIDEIFREIDLCGPACEGIILVTE
jgi:hypothetical protein